MHEERLQIAAAMHHAKDNRLFVFDAVHNHVFAHGQAAVADAEIRVTRAPDVGEAGERVETFCDGIDQPVGNLNAATFPGDTRCAISGRW